MREFAGKRGEKAIRILRVAGNLYPSFAGGIALHAHEMSKWQVRLGHNVTVYTSSVVEEAMLEIKDGYKVVRFKSLARLMGNPLMPGLFPKLLHTRNTFDIIHAHSHLFLSTNLCALARRLGSPPLIITNHGLISQTAPLPIQKVYIPTVAKWTLQSSDMVICYTETEKAKLEEIGINSNNIKVIHNGIDTDIFTPCEKRGGKTGSQILWVGRFVPGKGIEHLINAFNILVQQHQHYRLTMVGKGPLQEKINQKIQNLGLSQHISLRSFVPNSEIHRLYQDSDVFVLTSLNEGVPRTILEAMACGIPVISTELPQLVDIVEGCGLTVPIGDPQAVADAVSRITTSPELAKKLGEAGRAKVVGHYSWEDTVRKTVEAYQELL